jgi:hypothetical protein
MTADRFRLLLAVYCVLFIAGIVVSFIPGGYSQELTTAYANEPAPAWMDHFWAFLGIVAVLLIGMLVSYVGMFFFKPWARTLALVTTIISIALIPFSGAALSSAAEQALFETSSILWGVILALAYWAPVVSDRFSPRQAPEAPNSSTGD